MTPQQFIEKFPDSGINCNCLEDIACPECGSRDRLSIAAESVFRMCDDGSDGHEDIDYNSRSWARCGRCGHTGIVLDFSIVGLDDALRERESEQ